MASRSPIDRARRGPLDRGSGRGGPRRGGGRGLPPVLRDWRAGVGLLAFLIAAVVAIAALSGGGEDDAPPAASATQLVPADALAYLHVSTDGGRAPVRRALALLDRLGAQPAVRAQLTGLLQAGDSGVPVDLERDVLPWLGDEAALALTRGSGTTAGSLLLLRVADEAGARRFLSRTAGPARPARYRSATTSTYRNGSVTAFVGGFLAIGQRASVRGAIDRADGVAGARSLAEDATYRRATDGEPQERVLDAYASVDGVRRLLAPQPGALGLAGALLDQPGLQATALVLTAEDAGARVRVNAVLDPRARGGAAASFTPTLTSSVPRDALAYAGFGGLARAAPLLLGLGGVAGLGSDTAGLMQAAARLLRERGVDFARDVLPLFGQEVAVTVVPTSAGPQVALLARTPDEAGTRTALRRVEPALAQLFAPDGGAPPAFADATAGSVATRRLDAGAGVELDYAVADGVLAVSTGAQALTAVMAPRGTIGDSPAFEAVIPDSQSKLTSIVFFDFRQLLSLFEPLGLTGASGLAADLQRIRAVGLVSTSGEAQSTAELTFEIP